MTDRDVVRRGYDEIASTYAEQRSEDADGALLEAVLDTSRDDGEPTVLDAGCGCGTPGVNATVEGTVVGLDISRGQLLLGREEREGTAFLQGDMTRLPFRTGSFDAVVASFSLIHVPLGDHPGVLAEFARVLRPGGRLLLTEGSSEWTGRNPDWLDTGVEMQWGIAGADRTRTQLRAAGFSVVEEVPVENGLAEDEDAWMYAFVAELADP